jgi:hypothetical protein
VYLHFAQIMINQINTLILRMIFRFLRCIARPWTCVELIRRYPHKPPRLDLLSVHPSHHTKGACDPGFDVHTNVRPH